ncbi:MAG: WD40/YVTN/BNR-like repeat-containing protein [Chloroflexota bacterium]
MVAVAGHPREPATFYFGAVAGGIWKTTDGGTYWENISDGWLGTSSIGALAVAASDPNVVYAGTGEATIRGDVSHGDGVYKSTDAGKTWTNVGLTETRHIAKVFVHPRDENVVYVAALGHAWGPNSERGLFRSVDGGTTWEKILYRDERTGAIDLAMDPNNPRILFSSFWQVQRSPYSLESGGPGSGMFRSTDGGDSWSEISRKPGLPSGVLGKIGLAVSPAKVGRVWALVEAKDGALFRSDDAGEHWERLSEAGDLRERAWYYMHLAADPHDQDTIWVLNIQCWKSIDGGRNFQAVPTPHGDNHDLWIDPLNPLRMIEGNDGGACVSYNGGLSWSTLYNQPTAQLYHVATDSQFPYRVYGSQQDNTAISLPSRSVNGAISEADWYEPGGGESGYIAVKPDDPNIVYGGATGSGYGSGLLFRYDHRTGQEQNITVWPEDVGMGEGADRLIYRFQWTFPIEISPFNSNILYVASNKLLRSEDEGRSWTEISPDLTKNEATKQVPSGGPITKDNTGVEVYGTIFAFVESAQRVGEFWVGTDDGLMHLSRDAGQTWENITPANLPDGALVSTIDVSRHKQGVAYVAATRYKLDDTKPYLLKTTDYGGTWELITNGIPDDDFTRVIRADPEQPGLLYAGTETAAYLSFNDGRSWRRLQGNLPVAPIHDLRVKDADLIVATHGRSFWILDDLTPLRQIAAGRRPHDVVLYSPAPTVRFKTYHGYEKKPTAAVLYGRVGTLVVGYRQVEKPDGLKDRNFLDAGKNPPDGVIVTYFLPGEPEGEVTLTFLDDQGTEIRRYSSVKTAPIKEPTVTDQVLAEGKEGLEGAPEETVQPGAEQARVPKAEGMNRFVWDLRVPEAHRVPGDKTTEDDLAGPRVLPGDYIVRLEVAGSRYDQPFELLKDPRVEATPEDLRAQYDLLLAVRDKLSATHDAINEIRDLRKQLDAWKIRLVRGGDEDIQKLSRDIGKDLTDIENELIDTNPDSPLYDHPSRLNSKLALLSYFVDSADAAPTAGSYAVYEDLSGRIDHQFHRLRSLVDGPIAQFNGTIQSSGVSALALGR